MSAQTIEERLAAVETKLEQLERENEQNKEQHQGQDKAAPWWERFVGIFEDNSEFEEAIRYGQKWRASEENAPDEDAI